jgi:signal transduction histidine kinase
MQFRIAFQNLLRNATKALTQVDRDRRIDIELFNPRQNDELVYVRVRDNGPGIPIEQQTRIFEKGFTTKLGHGLGLGLSLAASAVSASGGILKLERSDRAGTEFVIVLPASLNATTPGTQEVELGEIEEQEANLMQIEEMENYSE